MENAVQWVSPNRVTLSVNVPVSDQSSLPQVGEEAATAIGAALRHHGLQALGNPDLDVTGLDVTEVGDAGTVEDARRSP